MCTAKPPKATAPTEKDPQYMRNPWLDSMSMTRASTVGRNSLRTDSARRAPSMALPPPTGPYMPAPTLPRNGGGGYMGGGGGGVNTSFHLMAQ